MVNEFETLRYSVEGGIAEIKLDRPDALNAMSPKMAEELNSISLEIDADRNVRVIILIGEGKAFCAGGDLGVFKTAGEGARKLILKMTGDLHLAISRIARNSAPVIAAVNGTAAGAGFSLVMAADLAIASEKSVFTMAYTNAGLSPDGSSTYFMPRKIGDRRTRELMMTNRVLSSQEALSWGVVNQVVSQENFDKSVRDMAAQIATGSASALGKVKDLLDSSFDYNLEGQMEREARAIADQVVSQDGQEGMSAFLEKRKPDFS